MCESEKVRKLEKLLRQTRAELAELRAKVAWLPEPISPNWRKRFQADMDRIMAGKP